MLKIGDKMPYFEAINQKGIVVDSEDIIAEGKKTIIYFYPKDNTPGCTAEACNFRDNFEQLAERGYNVIGVSKDSVKSHKRFSDKFLLPFSILTDASNQMLQDFGVWVEKKACRKTTMGVVRKTFIFNQQGILERIIDKVDTKNAASQILEEDK